MILLTAAAAGMDLRGLAGLAGVAGPVPARYPG